MDKTLNNFTEISPNLSYGLSPYRYVLEEQEPFRYTLLEECYEEFPFPYVLIPDPVRYIKAEKE